MERWGIAISDLHSGSVWGLRAPNYTQPGTGDHLRAGPIGRKLHREFKAKVAAFSSPDFMIVGGDCVEGAQRKDGSKWLWTPDVGVQAQAAVPFLDDFNAGVVFGVQGTKYHVEDQGRSTNADEVVMSQVKRAADQNGRFAPPDRYVHAGGAVIHVSHKIGGTSVFQYRGTAPSRELAMNRVMSYATEVHKCDLILRGHVHHFYEVRAGVNTRCIAMPCWKCRDDYAGTMHPFTWMPHMGLLLIVVKNGRIVVCDPYLVDFPQQRPPLEELDEWLVKFGLLDGVESRPAMPLEFPDWLQTVAPAAPAA